MGLLSTIIGIFSDRSGFCAGCGRRQVQVAELIKGPGLSMCDQCVNAAATLIESSNPPWRLDRSRRQSSVRSGKRCSFCGKDSEEVGEFVQLAHGSICRNCVQLCTEILIEAPDRANSSGDK